MKKRIGLVIVLSAIFLSGCTSNNAPDASDDIDMILPAEGIYEQDGIGVEQHEFSPQKW